MFKLFDLFKQSRLGHQFSVDKGVLYNKYSCFKRILAHNNSALEIIADLENIIYQDKPFSFAYVFGETELLIRDVLSIAEDLNALTGNRYSALRSVAAEISEAVFSDLKRKKKIEETSLMLPLERLSLADISEVGGKAANLGEVYNRVNLPVPPGFAVTAYACHQFLEHNHLTELIEKRLKDLDVNDTEKLNAVSGEIQLRVMEASLPTDLERSILQGVREIKQRMGPDIRLSVRSSATGEDSEASFAGQHSTVLNVSEENVLSAYKEVVSSTFNPRAIFYRRTKGYLDQDVVMSVACLVMIHAKASGVIYTLDPNDSRHAVIMISAVWGLAANLVEGSTSTDFYQVNKKSREIENVDIAAKETLLRPDIVDGLKEEPIADELKQKSCLEPEEVQMLVDNALKLEKHYGYALDIEWAIDQMNRLFILQARPLRRSEGIEEEVDRKTAESTQALAVHPVLLKGGASASDGTAAGLAFVMTSEHILHHIPEGAIVIARQTSPRYVPLMGRIQAIVTDVGSVTGHMASVAREFHIPALVGTGSATEIIPHGEEITVDATNRTVYRGRVETLLKTKRAANPMKGSPIHRAVQAALKRIAPLNLTDPKLNNFNPQGCRTIHDVIRFAHEMAMQEMFTISDDLKSEAKIALPLRVYLPIKILIVDLGGGLSVAPGAREASAEHVTSAPFRALLNGMTHKDVSWTHHVGVNWRGIGSIVAESLLRDPMTEGPMGGPSYAIVAGRYLNFSSRLGYHFVTVDTFCGSQVNDNYITFYFKGGAADIGRRSRRALLIALVLKRLGFMVVQKGDMVRGEMKKYESSILEDKLAMVGRLLGSVNLLDMVLTDDRQIEWYSDQFFDGNYAFQSRPVPPEA
jgi:pyruvate,water dikinase